MHVLDVRITWNRLEQTIVGIFISLACPASFLIAAWWTSAGLSIFHVVPISDQGIATIALAGLGLGILLDVLCLKRWMARFYDVDWRLAVPIYLYWVMIATASFMGLPLGTVTLGILAGLYLGRRHRHAAMPEEVFARLVRTGSLQVAAMTGVASLGVGVLALGDAYIVADIQRVLGTSPSTTRFALGPALVVVLSLILVAVQYWCTRTAATLAFRWRRRA